MKWIHGALALGTSMILLTACDNKPAPVSASLTPLEQKLAAQHLRIGKLVDQPTEEEIKRVSANRSQLFKFSSKAGEFLVLAQKDINLAAKTFGDAGMQKRTQEMPEWVAKIFTTALQSSIMGLAMEGGDQPTIFFYDPISDLLLITNWSAKSGEMTGSEFMTGNHLLGLPGYLSMQNYGEYKNFTDKAVISFRTIRRKIFEYYPEYGEAPSANNLAPMENEKLWAACFAYSEVVQIYLETWEKHPMERKAFLAFVDALKRGDPSGLRQIMTGENAVLGAQNLSGLPEVLRKNVKAFVVQPLNDGVWFFAAAPEFPFFWYQLKADPSGKISTASLYNMATLLEVAEPAQKPK
jgi:hypothetical protein